MIIYFVHDAILNRQERVTLAESMRRTMTPLSLDDVQQQRAHIVDTRDAASFSGGHLRGAINIGVVGKYATWAGTILDKRRPIVIVADDERLGESVMRLGQIGFDHVAGYLDGGMDALAGNDEWLGQIQRITPLAAAELVHKTTVDVRTAKERDQGHIEGSLHVPLNRLVENLADVPEDGPTMVVCRGGYRSAIAASLLKRNGFENVWDLVGGYQAWVASRLPVVETAFN
jgi:hydroxyacylglutathione hydrolase